MLKLLLENAVRCPISGIKEAGLDVESLGRLQSLS
jgi:hypothetical protein